MVQTLTHIFCRDLENLKKEIASYTTEENIWAVHTGIANSGGNLCLHLIGNLNTYIGAQIGNTGYVRHRDLEFSLKNVPRTELITKIDNTITVITNALNTVTDNQLKKIHPFLVFEKETTLEYLLAHLTTHLTYHLGQINYHRRLLDNPA